MKKISLALLLGVSFVGAAHNHSVGVHGCTLPSHGSEAIIYIPPSNVISNIFMLVMVGQRGALDCGKLPAWLREHQQGQVLLDGAKQGQQMSKQQPNHHDGRSNHRSFSGSARGR